MSYLALVARIKTKPHPNADRVLLGDVAGYQVVVGKDTKDGELGVFFPEGGELSHEFCMANKLYTKHPETGEPMGGYFSSKRRVKAQNFRKEKSEGLWVPLSYFKGIASDEVIARELTEGEQFDTVGGHQVCKKYYTPATLRAMKHGEPKSKKSKVELPLLRHYDTKQLRFRVESIPVGSVLYFTEKLHGTSGRTGYLEVAKRQWATTRLWNWLTPKKFNIKPKKELQYISGTRNCIVDSSAVGEKGKGFRQEVHDSFVGKLLPGETAYYEIVGFEGQGRGPIMATHGYGGLDKKDKKAMVKNYGEPMVYSYGCNPELGEFRVYIYRMTMDKGNGEKPKEYTFNQIVDRCLEMKMYHVPLLKKRYYGFGDKAQLRDTADIQQLAEELSLGASTLDPKHIREGVCVRAETPIDDDLIVGEAMKFKSYWFKVLEGIVRDSDNYVDPEEIS